MTKLIYLFDPLCGWCYAISPVIQKLRAHYDITPQPTGLFARTRPMDAAFIDYAWQNDQRIAALTGLPFSERYRQNVLKIGNDFNSRALCQALALAQKTMPERTLDLLAYFQQARYDAGIDTGSSQRVRELLVDGDWDDLANYNDSDNQQTTNLWLSQGAALASSLNLQGVPKLLVEKSGNITVLTPEQLHGDFESLLAFIEQL